MALLTKVTIEIIIIIALLASITQLKRVIHWKAIIIVIMTYLSQLLINAILIIYLVSLDLSDTPSENFNANNLLIVIIAEIIIISTIIIIMWCRNARLEAKDKNRTERIAEARKLLNMHAMTNLVGIIISIIILGLFLIVFFILAIIYMFGISKNVTDNFINYIIYIFLAVVVYNIISTIILLINGIILMLSDEFISKNQKIVYLVLSILPIINIIFIIAYSKKVKKELKILDYKVRIFEYVKQE